MDDDSVVFTGELIENFITMNGIRIMNDKSYTHHSPSTKPMTSMIFPSAIHQCFLIIIGLYVKTYTKVIVSLSSLNRTLFPLTTTC